MARQRTLRRATASASAKMPRTCISVFDRVAVIVCVTIRRIGTRAAQFRGRNRAVWPRPFGPYNITQELDQTTRRNWVPRAPVSNNSRIRQDDAPNPAFSLRTSHARRPRQPLRAVLPHPDRSPHRAIQLSQTLTHSAQQGASTVSQ